MTIDNQQVAPLTPEEEAMLRNQWAAYGHVIVTADEAEGLVQRLLVALDAARKASPPLDVPDFVWSAHRLNDDPDLNSRHPDIWEVRGPWLDSTTPNKQQLCLRTNVRRSHRRSRRRSGPDPMSTETYHESNHHGWGGPCENCSPCPHHGADCPANPMSTETRDALREALVTAVEGVLGRGEVSTVDGSMGTDRAAGIIFEAMRPSLDAVFRATDAPDFSACCGRYLPTGECCAAINGVAALRATDEVRIISRDRPHDHNPNACHQCYALTRRATDAPEHPQAFEKGGIHNTPRPRATDVPVTKGLRETLVERNCKAGHPMGGDAAFSIELDMLATDVPVAEGLRGCPPGECTHCDRDRAFALRATDCPHCGRSLDPRPYDANRDEPTATNRGLE